MYRDADGNWYNDNGSLATGVVLGSGLTSGTAQEHRQGGGEPSCSCGEPEANGGIEANNGGYGKVVIRYVRSGYQNGGDDVELVVEEEARGEGSVDLATFVEDVKLAWQSLTTS